MKPGLYYLFLLLAPALVAAPPNFLFILGDDINRDHIGCYGGVDAPTPHIDRIAQEGVQFMRAYASTAMCASFRQELYSGRTPWRTRAFLNHSHSVPGTPSIPLELKKLGYAIGLAGKTHIGPKAVYPFDILGGGKGNEGLLNKGVAFVEKARKAGKPWCLFLCSNDAHSPFTTGDPSQFDAKKLRIPPYWIDTPGFRKALVPYLAEVAHFDALAGLADAWLQKEQLADNTLFMVCTEQGSQFPFAKWSCYDNGLRTGLVARWPGVTKPGHRCEELVWLPDIAPTFVEAAGGKVGAGTFDGKSLLPMLRGEAQVNHAYVFGAFANKGIIGNKARLFPIRSIRSKTHSLIWSPNTKGQTSNLTLDKARGLVFGEGGDGSGDARIAQMPEECAPVLSWVRDAPKHPLIHKLWSRPEYELYDLVEDPYELENRVNHPEHSATRKQLQARLMAFLRAQGDEDPMRTERELTTNKGKKK